MRANERGSYRPLARPVALERAPLLARDTRGSIVLRTPNEHGSARDAAIAHALTLLIYLKHRGVLNIEEFRRTNARGL